MPSKLWIVVPQRDDPAPSRGVVQVVGVHLRTNPWTQVEGRCAEDVALEVRTQGLIARAELRHSVAIEAVHLPIEQREGICDSAGGYMSHQAQGDLGTHCP